MRVVLEVAEGKAVGRKSWLLAGQVVVVGRSHTADLVIAEDTQLSSRHFEVLCGSEMCQLKDLNSTNGTLVNGARIQVQMLRDGDEILAGQTRFTVTVVADEVDAAQGAEDRSAGKRGSGKGTSKFPTTAAYADNTILATTNEPSVLVLDVQSPGVALRRIWLRPERPVSFGRGHQADEAFAADDRMSGLHFVLEPTSVGWRCRDVGSTNGTYLNDVRIAEGIIHTGDRILAGFTTFLVHDPSGTDIVRAAGDRGGRVAEGRPASQRVTRAPRTGELVYRRLDSHSGLSVFLGQTGNFDAAVVAQSLVRATSPVLVGDEASAVAACPSAKLVPLIDNPTRVQGLATRMVIESANPAEWSSLLVATWGKDETALAIPAQDNATAIAALQALSQAASVLDATGRLRGLHPLALVEHLANSPPAGANLYAAIRAIFVEAHQGERWTIVAPADREPELRKLGFRPAAAWE